ncbi:unnamed protein product [Ectocarpus sp. CCAP 1310/34]|nr:unnamed protein product [Ectocarpus sp. CCAP 1310/34]
MTTSKLFITISICSEAIRYLRAHKQEEWKTSYDHVMQSLPAEDKTEHVHTNLTKACMEFMKAEVFDKDTSDRKVMVAIRVAVSIAIGEAQRGLAKEICDRLRKVEDFNRYLMTEVFNLSIVTDRVCTLLDDVIIHQKKHVSKDIQQELCVEFVVLFFGIVESILRRGHCHTFSELGYATSATPSDMGNARNILEKHVSAIAAMCGPCFILKALKEKRPRLNLLPANGTLPQTTTLGTDHVDFASCGIYVLKSSLSHDSKETKTFLDIIFATMSLSHKTPADTFDDIRLDTTRTFFLDKVLDRTDADQLVKKMEDPKVMFKENLLLKDKVKNLAQELSSTGAELVDTKSLLQQEKGVRSELEADKKSLLASNQRSMFRADMAESSADKKRVVDLYESGRTKLDEANTEIKKLKDTIDGKKPRVDRPKICPHQLADSMYFGSGYRTP